MKNKTKTRRVRELIGKRRKNLGTLGEMLVVKHLMNKGFRHLESNFLRRQGELDVIMENSGVVHFIEVKTVSREMDDERANNVIHETRSYMPEENVSPWKLRKISRVVRIYISEKNLQVRPWQFDVAVVFLDRKNRKAYIKFIKDIPLNG